MADNRTRSPIPESLPTDVVGPYAITAYCDGSCFCRRHCAGDQSGRRERGGGKRDGADRALDSYFVPLDGG
jgi:hypothetical protein